MQSSGVLSCRTGELSRPEKCSQQSRNTRAGFSRVAVSAIASRQHEDANRRPARTAEIDSRTKMLLEQPIAPMILRLAIPNATVMLVQILIGLVEVYFVSRTGVDALAGVAPVFPLVSLVVAVAQGAIGGGVVTTVARALGPAGSALRASMRGTPWPSVFHWASRRRPPGLRWVQTFTARWASPEMLWRSPFPIHLLFLQVPR